MHGCSLLGRTNEPRRKPRQGTPNELAFTPRPRDGVRSGCVSYSVLYVKTTLGNGYLGSRIDEERSEMRYLV